MVEILSKSETQTKKVAKLLAEEIIKKPLKTKGAAAIGLEGELGSGKTRFVQGFARGLGIKSRLTSPTFVLIKKYKNLYHIDCYRLNKPKDLLDLDFKEIISDPKNIVVIEWAEKVRSILPKDTIWIKFEIINQNKRKIKIL
jgi:tRNA threonylcarbamoyladenosine biosynthesis protein TsaE